MRWLGKVWRIFLYRILFKNFYLFEKIGIHATPVHYYQPVPDTRTLKESLWTETSSLKGIDLNIETQLKFINDIVPKYRKEYSRFPINDNRGTEYKFVLDNQSFDFVDVYVLYCMVRYRKPEIIIEIGSGISTAIAAAACLKNKSEGVITQLTSIDPYPDKNNENGINSFSNLINAKAEDIEYKFYQQLNENDILFIDSSHVVRIGGDVVYEYLEILPRLKKGVIVHFHDICLPINYPKEWVLGKRYFWNEQYLLQAFLMYNHAYEILWAGNFMHMNYREMLYKTFLNYDGTNHWPGSFWIRKVMD